MPDTERPVFVDNTRQDGIGLSATTGGNMRWFYVAVIAVLALVTLIFALQNLQSVTVSLLRLQLSAPLAVLIIIVYVLGMATGGSAWALVRWAWQGSRVS